MAKSDIDLPKGESSKISTDAIFGDTSYKLTLTTFDSTTQDPDSFNAILTFYRQFQNETITFFKDSLYCMYPNIEFQDFNNDQVKDVLVFNYTGGRSNPTYYLYLVNEKENSLIRVNGFEQLPNPDLDSTNNIITSIALSGANHYAFYRINNHGNLINLQHDFFENPKDSTQYSNAIKQILNEAP